MSPYVPEYGYLLHYNVFRSRQASFILISDIRVLNSAEWCSAIRIHFYVWHNIKLLYIQIFTFCDVVGVGYLRSKTFVLEYCKIVPVLSLKACGGVDYSSSHS